MWVLAQITQVLAWLCILAASFLRHAGVRETLKVGAEGLGWVALLGSGMVGSHLAAVQSLNCTLWGQDCIGSDAEAWAYLWDHLGRGLVIDVSVAIAAALIGWLAARVYRRRPSTQW
ncbi:hypothetical protein AVL62_10115 [Serinicoccus chungangensis]|uniref:Uncharacterized protein n=1 Tax=Serinicoccus chungangensis TaxID=767452 RepID=A0A0W8I1P9_9MICO|nr:hypothetical protein AVL62_10115 [Serinicoccus chungangensis]